ncbi:MAG: cupin domain-containing protein [Candidatus Omnitrophota bacterium]
MKKARPFIKTLTGNRRFKRLLGVSGESRGMRSGLVAIKPGESVGWHSTERKEEALIILDGKAKVCLGKKTVTACGSSFVYLPRGVCHNVQNSGAGILRYVYLTYQPR